MNKTKLVHERIEQLLKEQNSEFDVRLRIMKFNINTVQIHIKTPFSFLQINNLSDILDNTFCDRAFFIIDDNCTLNVQSTRNEYSIQTGNGCFLHSFYLSKTGSIYTKLGKNTTFIYKGPHDIKTNVNCIISNANKR